jgi:hypothetical protein
VINYGGDSTLFPAIVRLPEDDDVPSAAVLQAGLVDLADRTAYLHTTHLTQNKAVPFLNGVPVGDFGGSAVWTIKNVSDNYALLQKTAGLVRWIIDITGFVPDGAQITNLLVTANGDLLSSGAHTHPINTYPNWRLTVLDNTGTVSAEYSYTDDNATASYDVEHTFDVDLSASNISVDPEKRYLISVVGEAGTNSLNDHYGVKRIALSWL